MDVFNPDRILAYLQARRSRWLTAAPPGPGQVALAGAGGAAAGVRLADGAVLSPLDFAVRRVRPGDRWWLYAGRPASSDRAAPLQLLLGHCDTVWPVGTLERMPVLREGNILRGPGVFDMKGGLVLMVAVLQALHAFSSSRR